MRMIRVRVDDADFDYLTTASFRRNLSLAAFVRDVLHAVVVEDSAPVSDDSDTTEPDPAPALPPQRKGVGRPSTEQWERLNKWMYNTGRAPEPGTIKTRSGLMAWAVGQGFQP